MANHASIWRFTASMLAFALVSGVAWAEPPDYRPSPVEATLLPKFCWHQFLGARFSGPRYSISRKACGAFVNHYCPGLIDLNRANRTFGNDAKRRADLLRARENTLYTLRGTKGFPNCPLRSHAEATLRVINDELNAFR